MIYRIEDDVKYNINVEPLIVKYHLDLSVDLLSSWDIGIGTIIKAPFAIKADDSKNIVVEDRESLIVKIDNGILYLDASDTFRSLTGSMTIDTYIESILSNINKYNEKPIRFLDSDIKQCYSLKQNEQKVVLTDIGVIRQGTFISITDKKNNVNEHGRVIEIIDDKDTITFNLDISRPMFNVTKKFIIGKYSFTIDNHELFFSTAHIERLKYYKESQD